MSLYLGIDTSNYTTSAALYDDTAGVVVQQKELLPVKSGALGLRQSDAVFSHVKQLGSLVEQLMAGMPGRVPERVGVSVRPRDMEGSYMPCFLVGELAARSIAAACGVPLSCFSHQAGHVAAALYSAGHLELMERPFAAFHLSGGTTECVLVRPGTDRPLAVELFSASLDLKAGQAVDRVGGMLGLPFPAGRRLEELAQGSAKSYTIRPAMKGRDCSLSGIENKCQAMLEAGEKPCDIARFCLDSLLAAVLAMTRALKAEHGDLPVVYAGGVMSNAVLQQGISEAYGGFFAKPEFSSDNAAGVAVLASRTEGGA